MVRAGYKQTEVGVIPEDWSVPSIGDLFSFKNGLNKSKEFFGVGTPIVNYMDVYSHTGLNSIQLLGRVTVGSQELKAFEVRKGDVFFTRTSETVAEIGIASVLLDDSPQTVFSGFILRARPNGQDLDDEFKKFCFLQPAVRQQIIAKSTYTTRALTSGKVLSSVKIPLPPKGEQQAIAVALSDADGLIESLEKLIAKKRLIKQGAMQELLTGKKRLPCFSKEWSTKKVAEFGEVVTGGTPLTGEVSFWGGDIPWVTPTDITDSKDVYSSERHITDIGESSIRALPKGALLITCIASIGKNAILRRRGACNQQINAIVPNNEYDIDFLYYLFEAGKSYLLANAGITATLIISKKDFSELTFLVPDKGEQEAIATILSNMDSEIFALEQKLAKARQIKQGMMQELLTGRIRLI